MKISSALDHIDSGQLALPEFQRGYVWNRNQVRGLMHSLYRGHPVGSLLIWSTEAGNSEVRGDLASKSGNIQLLLDGQQRITSLYGVMRGHAPTFFQGDSKSFLDLYFNVESETFEFYGPVKMRDDPTWIPITPLFADGIEGVFDHLESGLGDGSPLLSYMKRLTRLHNLQDLDIHEDQITGKDRTVDEVVEIFNRINSGGTKLSAGDLALARICADWPEARETLRRIQGDWSGHGYEFSLDWLLRCVTAVATGQSRFTALQGIEVPAFAEALQQTEKYVNSLLNLIGSRLGLDHDRVLKGRGAFAALCFHLHQSGGPITASDEQQKILYWYLHNLMWGRYSGTVETKLQQDLAAFSSGGIDAAIDELRKWRGDLEVRASDFDWSTTGARFYPILYMLTRTNGSRNLCDGIELRNDLLGKMSQLHVHHIFPKARLYDVGTERTQVNALANMCFLTADCNLKISDRPPIEYMAVTAEEQPGALESQWITTDPDLWDVDRFADFLEDRRHRLADATNAFLQSLLDGGAALSDDEVSSTPVSVAEETSLDEDLVALLTLLESHGVQSPVIGDEVADAESGVPIATVELHWPDGIQAGLTEPVCLSRELASNVAADLSSRGTRVFSSIETFIWYLETQLEIDLDGDEVVGRPDAL